MHSFPPLAARGLALLKRRRALLRRELAMQAMNAALRRLGSPCAKPPGARASCRARPVDVANIDSVEIHRAGARQTRVGPKSNERTKNREIREQAEPGLQVGHSCALPDFHGKFFIGTGKGSYFQRKTVFSQIDQNFSPLRWPTQSGYRSESWRAFRSGI